MLQSEKENMINKDYKKSFVLSLGGSIIVPNGGIDTKFLKEFEQYIRKKVAQGCHFFIVTGGGSIGRHYIDAAGKVIGNKLANSDRDWLGIHSTRLNAHLLRTIFQDIAYDVVIKEFSIIYKEARNFPVVIAAGWKPGWSTDYDAVMLAHDYHIGMVVNLSNVEMVYDKDPNKFPDAKPIKKINWSEMTNLVGKKWTPGLNTPFDPMASQMAMEIGLKVVICNGRNLENLDNIIEGKNFMGTVIR